MTFRWQQGVPRTVLGLELGFVFHRNSSSAEVKNEWSCTCTPPAPHPYVFMVWTVITLPVPVPFTVTGTSLGLSQAPVYCLTGTIAADEVLLTKLSADTSKNQRGAVLIYNRC